VGGTEGRWGVCATDDEEGVVTVMIYVRIHAPVNWLLLGWLIALNEKC
jgi:hypothetical protein